MRTKNRIVAAGLCLAAFTAPLALSVQGGQEARTLEDAAASMTAKVEGALAELNALREANTALLLPLRTELTGLEQEYVRVQAELDEARGLRNASNLDLTNLQREIDTRKQTTTRLSTLFAEYSRNFESRLHVAEAQKYADALARINSAPEDQTLSPSEVFAVQAELLGISMGRVEALAAGDRFPGKAVAPDGLIREGQFLVVGPTAIFRADGGVGGVDGGVGTAEQVVGRIDPVITPFPEEAEIAAASSLVETGKGRMPFDASNGKAHKIASTEDTLVEHIKKGGAIMYPILVMAGLALLVAVTKWIALMFVRKPGKKKLKRLFEAVAEGDEDGARRRVNDIKGPTGVMLAAGVDTMRRSRELMEEVMYEKVLVTRNSIQKGLPFIAICAASAPLLGLLGTVTGIINTFKQITVFGSGDVKSLSGGISEALITTKFGLIVAIPSLLLHAYLARRARGVITQMEASAIQFANEVAKSDEFGEAATERRTHPGGVVTPEHELVRSQVSEILTGLMGPLANDGTRSGGKGGVQAPS